MSNLTKDKNGHAWISIIKILLTRYIKYFIFFIVEDINKKISSSFLCNIYYSYILSKEVVYVVILPIIIPILAACKMYFMVLYRTREKY